MCAMCSFIIQCAVCRCCFASAPMHTVQWAKSLQCILCLQHPQSAAEVVLGLSLCSVEYCTIVQCLCSVCSVFSVVHTVFALRWIPAGSLSADAHLHWGSGGWHGGKQTDMHTQTDRWIRANTQIHKYTNTHETQYTHHIQTERWIGASPTWLDVQRKNRERQATYLALRAWIRWRFDWLIDIHCVGLFWFGLFDINCFAEEGD